MLIRLCPNTFLMASTIRARMPESLPYLNKDRCKFAVSTTVQSKISRYNKLLIKKPVRNSSWQLKILYIKFITSQTPHACLKNNQYLSSDSLFLTFSRRPLRTITVVSISPFCSISCSITFCFLISSLCSSRCLGVRSGAT